MVSQNTKASYEPTCTFSPRTEDSSPSFPFSSCPKLFIIDQYHAKRNQEKLWTLKTILLFAIFVRKLLVWVKETDYILFVYGSSVEQKPPVSEHLHYCTVKFTFRLGLFYMLDPWAMSEREFQECYAEESISRCST